MQRIYTYAGVVGFATGIALKSVVPNSSVDIWFILLLATGLVTLYFRQKRDNNVTYIFAAVIFLVTFSFGTWRTEQYEQSLETTAWQLGEEVTFSGVVAREPDERKNTVHYYVTYNDETILVSTDRYQAFNYGDQIQVTGVIKTPTSFETDLGRTFNYPGYLKARGVVHTVSFAEIELIKAGAGNALIAQLLKTKSWFLNTIESTLPEPQAGLAQGLLLGVKRALGDELEQVFRSTGIIHIVVLSGYNIMLVVAFVMYVLAFLLPFRVRLLVGLLAIICFALMVGLGSTVVRASLMAALALVAKTIGRTYSVVQALMAAGVVMLLINPYLLVFDVGFQLSFLATLGLILVAPLLEKTFTQVPTFVGVREFLVATLATQLFVLPVLLYQIGEFSVVSVLVNVLVLPMVPVAMLLTFITVLVTSLSATLGGVVAIFTYYSLGYIIEIPKVFASLPFASFVVPPFPFWIVPVSYVFIAYMLYRWQKPKRPLSHWTIEEEGELLKRLKVTAPPSNQDTPVFFR